MELSVKKAEQELAANPTDYSIVNVWINHYILTQRELYYTTPLKTLRAKNKSENTDVDVF